MIPAVYRSPRMLRAIVSCATLLSFAWSVGQVRLGAAAGWSRSRSIDQGGPLVGLMAELPMTNGAARVSLELQLPGTHYSAFLDDGRGRLLSSGGWNDGHLRLVRGTTAMSMTSLGLDRLFMLDRERPDHRLELRLGPGFDLMLEGIRSERHIHDRTDSTFTLERWDHERLSIGLRCTLGASYQLPFGQLLGEWAMHVISFDVRAPIDGSAWFQRQGFRIGAVFPLADAAKRTATPCAAPE